MTDMDLVETSEIIPFHNSTSPIFNESIPRFFDRTQSMQIRFDFLTFGGSLYFILQRSKH